MHDTIECPNCFDEMPLVDDGSDQTTQCPECKRWYTLSFDADFELDNWGGRWRGRWEIREVEGPDWRDVEGDLRFHEGREEGRW